ncbi:hypothetical protein ACI513_17210 [Chryseobacterium sp. M5]|uniref:hypothetical protein n=1 Tax=Chryseobacterium sp. M5 TaxID=3379128 RepID=UPI0038579754
MQLKLFKQFFTVFLSFTASFIFAQDQIKINKIEVNGIEHTGSTFIALFKGTSATFKVNYTVSKYTPSYQDTGVKVEFYAKMPIGPDLLIAYDNQLFPFAYGTSNTFEFTTTISNATYLINSSDKAQLYLSYRYGNKITNSSNYNANIYNAPNNVINGDRLTNYMEDAEEIYATVPTLPNSNFSYTYIWQRKNPGGSWYNINNANSSNKNYVAPAAENKTNYRVRRIVKYSANIQHISNEAAVNVRIAENTIHETVNNNGGIVKNIMVGSTPKGSDNSYSYQWQELINNTWTNIQGATYKDYELPTITTTRTFRRMVGSWEVPKSYSNYLIANGLNIINNIITVSGNNGNLHPAEKVSIGEKPYLNILSTAGGTVTSNTGQPLILQWQKKTDGGNWEDISGATSANYIINSPLYKTTQYKRIGKSLYAPDNESNIITFEVSSNPKIDNNKISFDPANNDHILGTTPTGGDSNYSYIWVLDVHPDDSIGEMIQWSFSPATDTFLSEYLDYLPVFSDEIRITRYAISDNVWHRSNTLIYSLSGGIIQGRKAIDTKLELENKRETIAFIQNNELKFNFKNYQNYQAEIYIGNIATGQSVKAANHNIKNNNDSYLWNFPSHYLPGVYVYRIIFSDGTIKTGKVIRK